MIRTSDRREIQKIKSCNDKQESMPLFVLEFQTLRLPTYRAEFKSLFIVPLPNTWALIKRQLPVVASTLLSIDTLNGIRSS